jgi:hypothetical protein
MAFRSLPLDSALLLFDRETGINMLFEGPELAHLRMRAPRSVMFGITNKCNLACAFCSRDLDAESALHLRPSSPPPAVPRFDLVVTAAGDNEPQFIALASEALGLQEWDLGQQLLELPCTVARSLSAPRAEDAAALLRRSGAMVELVRNDG